MQGISFLEIQQGLPQERNLDLRSTIREVFHGSGRICIVVDDDPTGNQTVYNVPLLSEWSEENIENEILTGSRVFYLLTNSRSVPAEEAVSIGTEIGKSLKKLTDRHRLNLSLISRSDSTLRGHFPAEVDALAESVGRSEAIRILAPALFEGGRITLNDTHYIIEGNSLVPLAETPFANDTTFGYHSSDLKDWVEEKTGGRILAGSLQSVSLSDIREGGVANVRDRILDTDPGGGCIINAISYNDMDIVSMACHEVENRGGDLIYRTSSSFVPSFIGLEARGLLSREDFNPGQNGALVIIGSHIPKSTGQLNFLQEHSNITSFELEVPLLLDPEKSGSHLQKTLGKTQELLGSGKDVVLYTSRKVVDSGDTQTGLEAGRTVSAAMTSIVQNISVRPRYIIAKGGITSHDIAVKGLGMIRCLGKGQVLPGIPVWEMGEETRFPGMDYIVFPGNVGGEDALYELVKKLS